MVHCVDGQFFFVLNVYIGMPKKSHLEVPKHMDLYLACILMDARSQFLCQYFKELFQIMSLKYMNNTRLKNL